MSYIEDRMYQSISSDISGIESELMTLRQQIEIEFNNCAAKNAMLSAIDVALAAMTSVTDSFTALREADVDPRE